MFSQACRTCAAAASSAPASPRKAGPKSITGIARVASSTLRTAMALKIFIARLVYTDPIYFRARETEDDDRTLAGKCQRAEPRGAPWRPGLHGGDGPGRRYQGPDADG